MILVLLLPALVVLLSNKGERKSYYLLLASSNEDWPMLRRFRVPYGDSEKSFQLDEEHLLYHVEPRLPPRPSQKEEEARVTAALENPVGAYKLSDLLNPKDKVVLLTDDWTRTTPVYKIAPIVLEEVLNAGVSEKDIMVIVARGTHARLSKAQLKRKLGAEIVDRFTVENHDPESDLVNVGTSKMGTPAMINRRVVEADRKVAIGGIVAHPLMGYGGGAKIIVPGVAGTETININHSMGDHPKAAIGIANGNPVREDAEDIARMVGLDFIVNVIMNPKNEIVGAIAGDVVKAHREGVKIYDAMYGARVVKKADIVVLGASPRDATLYHGTFALPSAVPFVKEGGTVAWVAPCLSGGGSREDRLSFKELLLLPPEELMKSIKESARNRLPPSGSIFDWHTNKVVHRNKVVLVSDNISQKETEEFGFNYGKSIQAALDRAMRSEGEEAKVTVIPVGGLTVPIRE